MSMNQNNTYFGGSGGFSPMFNLLAFTTSLPTLVIERRFSSRALLAMSLICSSASFDFFSEKNKKGKILLHSVLHGCNYNISKILNFRNSKSIICIMLTNK